jgi:hypothetical protein
MALKIRHLVGLLAAALALAGCASGGARQAEDGVDRAFTKTSEGLEDAALTPLSDLNLRRVPIPARLEAIVSPYEPLAARTCAAIGAEIGELTAILGPDVDVPPPPRDSLDQRAGDGAAKLALNEVSSTASGFIPYRSLVRTATGASAHERRLRAAYERGMQRRAYLKGVGLALGCAPPAAPEAWTPPAPPTIEYRRAQPSG